jgi:Excalibur calcium-binding domain
MRVRTTAAAIVLAAAAMLPLAGIANAHAPDRDCSDFATQEEAQAYFNSSIGDLNNLDDDNDGRACEWLPSASSTAVSGQVRYVPQGGLDTGDGTMAADDGGGEVLVVGGMVLAGGLAAAAIRRRAARRSS